MQQIKLILFIIIIFIISSAYLLTIGNKFNDLNFGKDWWAVYFSDPKNNSLNFVIDNHSDNTNFHYVISKDKEKISEGDAKVENGKTENIKPDITQAISGNITIEVSTGDNDKKDIYKNF
jgi:hypothetical protein